MKKILSCLIGLFLISTGANAAEKENLLAEFEGTMLFKHVMDVFIQVVVSSEQVTDGTNCFSILPLSYKENKNSCLEIFRQTKGKVTCQDIQKSVEKLNQLDCKFRQNNDVFTASFSDMPSDINAFISDKAKPFIAFSSNGAMTYQNGTFMFDVKKMFADASDEKNEHSYDPVKRDVSDYLMFCSLIGIGKSASDWQDCKALVNEDIPQPLKEANILINKNEKSFTIKTRGLSDDIVRYVCEFQSWSSMPTDSDEKGEFVNFYGGF